MQFDQLTDEVKRVSLDTLRCDADNNFEAVVVSEEMDKLKAQLERFLGSPVFPSQHSLTFQMRQVVDGFGGIQAGQTLYFWSKDQETVFALLWPWKDGVRTTLKIIQQ